MGKNSIDLQIIKNMFWEALYEHENKYDCKTDIRFVNVRSDCFATIKKKNHKLKVTVNYNIIKRFGRKGNGEKYSAVLFYRRILTERLELMNGNPESAESYQQGRAYMQGMCEFAEEKTVRIYAFPLVDKKNMLKHIAFHSADYYCALKALQYIKNNKTDCSDSSLNELVERQCSLLEALSFFTEVGYSSGNHGVENEFFVRLNSFFRTIINKSEYEAEYIKKAGFIPFNEINDITSFKISDLLDNCIKTENLFSEGLAFRAIAFLPFEEAYELLESRKEYKMEFEKMLTMYRREAVDFYVSFSTDNSDIGRDNKIAVEDIIRRADKLAEACGLEINAGNMHSLGY